jgi:transposase
MAKILLAVGLACGGEGGARLADRLAMPVSPDGLLRAIRRVALPVTQTPRVLGVDDWAFRRGKRYGTILCDLERHRPVDLLPERSSEAFANWLKAHPGVEIVSRDRGDYYIKGATTGAPDAVQVTDRWHLLKNLREALVRVVDRHCQQVHAAARAAIAAVEAEPPDPPKESTANDGPPPSMSLTRAEQLKQERRKRRLDRYQRVVELHAKGASILEIGRQLGMHRRTVRRFLAAGCFPERAQRQSPRETDPFVDYLRRRWEEGCHNAAQLMEELRERGFEASYDMVRRRVASWRTHRRDSSPSECSDKRPRPPTKRPSSNRVAWLLFKPQCDLTPKEQALTESLAEHCPPLEKAAALSQEFRDMVRERKAQGLEDWIARASASEGVVELRRFAEGLRTDLAAVKAALSLSWSNGQVEGQVNRLKLIKRQMFGRAKFDLLRQRVLCAC